MSVYCPTCTSSLNGYKLGIARKMGFALWEFRNEETMEEKKLRMRAMKAADAINAIEGVPVSDYAKQLSMQWVAGELTGEQMRACLLLSHQKLAEMDRTHYG